ncbi:DUF4403 family protein [Flavobacterium crassostreae]|uniref:DUF4403 domain-containing protein n=1 Tax=Flavobacterium crassostreae TaxID=1763534 RepID=A0A1B9DXG4_9FLAO|nr:DUF4403 family protein [Flavobacterium crassostreae]OCB74376.1 hypothetical protein LPBF_10275 [Flavobacterium crassostreae]
MAKYLFVLSALCALLTNCATTQKIDTLKPEPDDATPLVYDNPASFIHLPISIKLKDIENQTNSVLNGLIYQDTDITDDNIEIKIWKLAPITIQNENAVSGEKIRTILPLKAIVKYRIGTKTLGVPLYNIQEFNLNGMVTLVSEVNLNNWKLNTKTKLKSLEWNQSPTMVLFGKNVPVTYLMDPAIQLFKSKIETAMDTAIENSMDFKPNVLAALEKICLPFQMDAAYESWFRVVPTEIYSTAAKLKQDTFSLQMGMKCTMETWIGQQPETKFDATKIVLKPVTKIPNQITATIVAVSTYLDASKIIRKNFAGQEFQSGSKKVQVQDVTLWHKNGKIVVALELTGSINGKIYLTGSPQYDNKSKEIYFGSLDYVLDTKNKLIRTANWLAQGYILNKIKASCRYSIESNLEEGKHTMQKYLQNYSPMAGVYVNGKMETLAFDTIQITKNAIIAFIKANGQVNITVDGLK